MITYELLDDLNKVKDEWGFQDKMKIILKFNNNFEKINKVELNQLVLIRKGYFWNSKVTVSTNQRLLDPFELNNTQFVLNWSVPNTFTLPGAQYQLQLDLNVELENGSVILQSFTTDFISINEGCVFCKHYFESEVEYEDDDIWIIQDRSPVSSTLHLLVIPKQHIINCNYLNSSHLPLLNHMNSKANEFIQAKGSYDPNDYIVGFHQPPFIMVHHLHLHVIILPMKSYFHYLLFNQNISWILTPIQILLKKFST